SKNRPYPFDALQDNVTKCEEAAEILKVKKKRFKGSAECKCLPNQCQPQEPSGEKTEENLPQGA
ncbi:MAG: hypothetical protein ACREGR_03935, partial [Minisyncoccia bacterium]